MTELADLERFDSFEQALLVGVAETLAAIEGAKAPLTFRADPDEIYTDDQRGIYLDVYPEVPQTTVTLSEYAVSDDPSLSDSVVGIQVAIWSRDWADVRRITSDVFNALHGRWGGTLGVVTLVSAARSSGTNVGQDSSERLGRTENYYLTVHRPSPNRN